jgi:short-subunit dehydrogenase
VLITWAQPHAPSALHPAAARAAGVEHHAAFAEQREEGHANAITLTVTAPMLLARLVLRRMLARRRGLIVNSAVCASCAAPLRCAQRW